MRLDGVFGALVLVGGCLMGSAAVAADWQIATVSGKAYRLVGTDWVRVSANDAFALGDTVKTLGSGTLTLTRDGVTVTIAPNSRVQIKERMNGKFTDVLQSEGSAAVEVDPRKHIRLAVETPYMAAVVKGTVFTVATYRGYSETAVQRGRVAVIDVANRLSADVTAGQKATSGEGQPLSLSGAGRLATPEPFKGRVVTRAADGTLVETKTETTKAETTDDAGKSNDGNGPGNSGKGNSNGNSGNGNSGKGSSGNSGNGNSGSSGNGNGNSGNGNGNSGNGNSGNGNGNSGNGNSGSGNSGHGNSGNGNGNSGSSGHGHGGRD